MEKQIYPTLVSLPSLHRFVSVRQKENKNMCKVYAGLKMRLPYLGFFMFITLNFGYQTCQLLKNFIRLTKRCVKLRIRVRFLKTCISCGFVPSHLNLTKYYDSIQFYNSDSKNRLESILYNHVKAVLRLELRDTYRQLHDVRKKIFKFHKIISSILPIYVGNSFFGQQRNNGFYWREEKLKMDKKIEWLGLKHSKKIKSNIKQISYGCSIVSSIKKK